MDLIKNYLIKRVILRSFLFKENKWPGVGHFNVNGGGSLNQFGKDFRSNGRTWNKKFCLLDR